MHWPGCPCGARSAPSRVRTSDGLLAEAQVQTPKSHQIQLEDAPSPFARGGPRSCIVELPRSRCSVAPHQPLGIARPTGWGAPTCRAINSLITFHQSRVLAQDARDLSAVSPRRTRYPAPPVHGDPRRARASAEYSCRDRPEAHQSNTTSRASKCSAASTPADGASEASPHERPDRPD
jgi:hypothetical protein